MNNNILMYGAGNNALNLYETTDPKALFFKEAFQSTVGFIDNNEKKHSELFLGKKVYSLKDALDKYPDSRIFITLAYERTKYNEIVDELMKNGVSEEHIINCRKTCDYLEHFIVCGYHEGAFDGKVGSDVGMHSFKSCCSDYGKNQVDNIIIGDNLEKSFDEFLELRRNLINKIANNEKCCCTGCPWISYSPNPISEKFYYVIFNELGKCNCKCSYCNYEERLGRDVSVDVDMVELYDLLIKKGYDEKNGIIELCNGEITIHPNKMEIYNALKSTNIMFLTNGLVYDEEITNRMKKGKAILNLSIDCGCEETFKKVKGISGFAKVVENLKKYSFDKKGKLFLKYIFIPGINDNNVDIDGFVSLCETLGVDMAHISCNLCQSFEEYNTPYIKQSIKNMVRMLEQKKIPYEIYSKDILLQLLNS